MGKNKVAKNVEIPKNFHRGKREKICRVLIEELSKWKSSEKVTTEEFVKLVEEIYKITN